MEDRPSYYAVIPASVRYDEEICANAKLLYGEITALASKEGYCWASNEHFSVLYGVHVSTISEWVRQLTSQKHIQVFIIGGKTRHIFIANEKSASGKGEAMLREKAKAPSGKGEHSIKSITKPYTAADAGLTDVPMESFLRGDLGDSKSPRISGDKKKAYDELIAWSENERGFPFPKTTRPKQYRAFKLANENGISRDALIERWEEMSSDKFWQKAGFDWMNVVQDVLKKPV